MALPNPGFYYTTSSGLITIKDFGSVQAGAYKPDSTGWSFRLYNAYGSTTSDTMTSVKVSVRDDDGGIDETWVEQHWVQLKSSSGSTGVTDDAQTVFTAVGKNKELSVGDIPSGQYRTMFARCYPPTDAEENASVEFQLRGTCQQPQSSICNWITGLRGNGIVASTGTPFEMSTGGTTGTIPYESGYALIYNNEIYYGSSGSYDISTTGSGTYSIYMNESGTFNETTGSVATNEMTLYEAVISSGTVSTLADKRVYIAGIQSGTTGAMSSTPDKGDIYFALNGTIYGAKTSTGWTAISGTTFASLTDTPSSISTGDAGEFVMVNGGGTALEFSPTTGFALDGWGTPSTGTSLNATTGKHGLLPILSGSSGEYLNGDGSFITPTHNSLGSLDSGDYLHLTATEDAGLNAKEQTISTTTGTANINWATSRNAYFVRSTGSGGQVTFTFGAPNISADLQLVIVASSAGSTGAVVWPTVDWKAGTEPTLSTGADSIDRIGIYHSTGAGKYLGEGFYNYSTA